MSETVLQKLMTDQQLLTRRAMHVVLITSLFIHILLNVFAYYNRDPILKIEMPVLSGVTIIAILIGMRMFRHD
ncbi:MAG TPA: hypothetical protein VI757_01855 [Bacteroidia bacterium]|nr:hypothetical protein [Bacteroidia bacterium]